MDTTESDRVAAPREHRDLLTIDALSDELGVSKHTLYKWRTRGTFPPARKLPNGRVVVRRSDLDDWFEDLPET